MPVEGFDEHPLADVLLAASIGAFPPPTGDVEVIGPDAADTRAVVALTGRAYVLTDRDPHDAVFDGVDAFGGATAPDFLRALAGPGAWIGSLDLVMVRRAGPATAPPLAPVTGHDAHPRVVRSRRHRRGVVVLGDDRGLVTIGRGLVGRTELSVELTGALASEGAGRSLIDGALATLPSDEPVFAQVAPGNAASVRAFLACGFAPIGSEVLLGSVGDVD